MAGALAGLRNRHLVVLDIIGIVTSVTIALAFGYRTSTLPGAILGPLGPMVALMLTTHLLTLQVFGLYGRDWRHASVGDLQAIVLATLLGSLVAAAIVLATVLIGPRLTGTALPRSFWPAEVFLTMSVVGGTRFGIRLASDHLSARALRGRVPLERQRTLLYGAGHVGALMARSAARNPACSVEPVGFLDDDPRLRRTRVAGLRVFGGLAELDRAAAATRATALLITMPRAPGGTVRRVVDAAISLGLTVRTVPPLEHLLDGTVDAYRPRRVRVEDLLRRPMATEHARAVTEVFKDRTVLITGGAGSIGSELARQVQAMGPRRLILLDRAESPLYLIERELRERARLPGSGEIEIRLGNIVSRAAMARLMLEERPDVVLHAAAYKHVPMLEAHPADAIQVNVAGTLSVLDAAVTAGVGRFVLVSTDKAVRPSSVMGATKRVAEMLVLNTARRTGRSYVAVRFGNVLGSAGSVVPIFQEQLESGRPLTVTHPDMTRYFMTIREAAWLILDAAAMGDAGDLFVLDMGEPLKVMDLARDVARLAGRDPDSQPIDIVGLRPGEKLHEELFYASERVEPTGTPKVMRVLDDHPVPADIRDQAIELIAQSGGPQEGLAAAIHAAAVGTLRTPSPTPPVGGMVPIMGQTVRSGLAEAGSLPD